MQPYLRQTGMKKYLKTICGIKVKKAGGAKSDKEDKEDKKDNEDKEDKEDNEDDEEKEDKEDEEKAVSYDIVQAEDPLAEAKRQVSDAVSTSWKI